eukprot:352144-Chlamydomonas_euryale.AAC.4
MCPHLPACPYAAASMHVHVPPPLPARMRLLMRMHVSPPLPVGRRPLVRMHACVPTSAWTHAAPGAHACVATSACTYAAVGAHACVATFCCTHAAAGAHACVEKKHRHLLLYTCGRWCAYAHTCRHVCMHACGCWCAQTHTSPTLPARMRLLICPCARGATSACTHAAACCRMIWRARSTSWTLWRSLWQLSRRPRSIS